MVPYSVEVLMFKMIVSCHLIGQVLILNVVCYLTPTYCLCNFNYIMVQYHYWY